jgi:hypothetical protein
MDFYKQATSYRLICRKCELAAIKDKAKDDRVPAGPAAALGKQPT